MMRRIALGELCEIQGGFAFRSSGYAEAGIRIVRISDVQRGHIDGSHPRYYPADAAIPEKYRLREGDLLVTLTGHVGRAAPVTPDMLPAAVNQRVARLRMRSDAVHPVLLRHLLASAAFEHACSRAAQGAAQQNLPAQVLREYPVPVPPPEEQTRLVTALLQAEALCAACAESLRKTAQLADAYFLGQFGDPVANPMGWKTAPLHSLCSRITDGMHGTPAFSGEGCYPFLNGSDLADGRLRTEGARMVSEEIFRQHGLTIPDNTILLSINGTLGHLACAGGESIVPGKSLCLLMLRPEICRGFVAGLLGTPAFRRWMASAATKSTIPNVSLAAIRQFPVILPPQEMQMRYAAFAAQARAMHARASVQYRQLQQLSGSLLGGLTE